MTSKKDEVKDILVAIKSVKARAKVAMANGDFVAYSNLMGDLIALECCLVGSAEGLMMEFEQLVEEERKKAA